MAAEIGIVQQWPLVRPEMAFMDALVSADGTRAVWMVDPEHLATLELGSGEQVVFGSSGGYGGALVGLGAEGAMAIQVGHPKKNRPKVWRWSKGKFVTKTPDLGLTAVPTVALCLSEQRFACGALDGQVVIANANNEPLAAFSPPTVMSKHISGLWSLGDALLVAGGDNGIAHRHSALHVYDLQGKHLRELGVWCAPKAAALSDDQAWLATGAAVGQHLQLTELATAKQQDIELPGADVRELQFCRAGSRLFVGFSDGWQWAVYDRPSARWLGQGVHVATRSCAAMDRSGERVLTTTSRGPGVTVLSVVELATGVAREVATVASVVVVKALPAGVFAVWARPSDAPTTLVTWVLA